jgi:hypothetical protein
MNAQTNKQNTYAKRNDSCHGVYGNGDILEIDYGELLTRGSITWSTCELLAEELVDNSVHMQDICR